MSAETTLHATCHCQSATLSFTVPTASLPLPTHFCHCSICRYLSGNLCTIHTPIPAPTVDLAPLTAYASSPSVTRYFCSTCGAHMFDSAAQPDGEQTFTVSTSLVDAPEETWNFRDHIYLDGTGDGGLAMWLREIGGRKLRMWKKKPPADAQDQEAGDWTPPPRPSNNANTDNTAPDNTLLIQCHCTGVSMTLTRPTPTNFPPALPPSLTPTDKTKWHGSLDVCTSCRLTSGTAIQTWLFPGTSHIWLADGAPYTHEFGTAKAYASSADVTRTFCGRCGATVVYACDDRPGMVDVAAGLARAKGARAEEWVEWRTEKVGWREDLGWRGLLEGLEGGVRAWGVEKEKERKG